MPKPLVSEQEFTRGTQWSAAQIKVWTERKTREQIAKLMAENQALRQMAEGLVAEIALRVRQG
jgi:serine protease inhibitor